MDLKAHAETLLNAMCGCLTELTEESDSPLEGCDCFHSNDGMDMCCDSVITWGLLPGPSANRCSYGYVAIMGTTPSFRTTNSSCAELQDGQFIVGYKFCPPRPKEFDQYNLWGDCITTMATAVQVCLTELACSGEYGCSDIKVGGVQASDDGFSIQVTVEL